MGLTINAIVLGVEDLKRSKQFYGDGLGLAIEQEQGPYVAFELGGGGPKFALYTRKALAHDAGVDATARPRWAAARSRPCCRATRRSSTSRRTACSG
jgi:catechol 2,3-dioxygenase-like lactoylglutathione lyase family enzyme